MNLQWAADGHKVKQQGSAVHAAMAWAALRVWQKEQAQDEPLDAHDAAQAEREATTAFKVWQGAKQIKLLVNKPRNLTFPRKFHFGQKQNETFRQ